MRSEVHSHAVRPAPDDVQPQFPEYCQQSGPFRLDRNIVFGTAPRLVLPLDRISFATGEGPFLPGCRPAGRHERVVSKAVPARRQAGSCSAWPFPHWMVVDSGPPPSRVVCSNWAALPSLVDMSSRRLPWKRRCEREHCSMAAEPGWSSAPRNGRIRDCGPGGLSVPTRA